MANYLKASFIVYTTTARNEETATYGFKISELFKLYFVINYSEKMIMASG